MTVPTREVSLGPSFDAAQLLWTSEYVRLPVSHGRPILLVPKTIARFEVAYDHQKFYRNIALEYLKAEHLAAGSSLVRTLKNGKRRVYIKDLKALYPCSKEFLFRFSRDHPETLGQYRRSLEELESRGPNHHIEPEEEALLAAALKTALQAIRPGGDAASTYHRLMVGVLEFLFFPSLVGPRKEPGDP